MRLVTRIAAAALSFLFSPAPALGGPPYATDDPEPVELHHWEVYLATATTFASAGVTGSVPLFEVNYGAASGLQLHAIAPLAIATGDGEPVRFGLGDMELGFKYRFLDEARAGVQAAFFPIVTVPAGAEARGLGEGGATALIPLWVQRTQGAWTTYGGAGFRLRRATSEPDCWFLGWLLQRRFGPIAIGAEVYRETESAGTLKGAGGFSVGVAADLSHMHHLLLSVGAEPDAGTLHAYFGWQLTFGSEE